MPRVARVECPRCKKIWTVQWAQPGLYCNCHLICPDGDKPSDCNFTTGGGAYPYKYTLQLGYPTGAHLEDDPHGEDVLHRTGYCSTHKKYTYRTPIWLEVDWSIWKNPKWRAPKKLRSLKKY